MKPLNKPPVSISTTSLHDRTPIFFQATWQEVTGQFYRVQHELLNQGIPPEATDLGVCLQPEYIAKLGEGFKGVAMPPIHSIQLPERNEFGGNIRNALNEIRLGLETGSLSSAARQAFRRLTYFGVQPGSHDARLAIQRIALWIQNSQIPTSLTLRVGSRFLTNKHDIFCIHQAAEYATDYLLRSVRVIIAPDYLHEVSLESLQRLINDSRSKFDNINLTLSLDIASLVMMIIRENPDYNLPTALNTIIAFALTNPELISEVEISPFATDYNPAQQAYGQKTAMSVTMGVPLSRSSLQPHHVAMLLKELSGYGISPGILLTTHPADSANGDLANAIALIHHLR